MVAARWSPYPGTGSSSRSPCRRTPSRRPARRSGFDASGSSARRSLKFHAPGALVSCAPEPVPGLPQPELAPRPGRRRSRSSRLRRPARHGVDQPTSRASTLRDRGLDVVDGHVGVPGGLGFPGRRGRTTDAGDVLSVELRDHVDRRDARGSHLRERPAEQPAVELLGRLDVIDLHVDPRRDAGRVGACFSHAFTLGRTTDRRRTPEARRDHRWLSLSKPGVSRWWFRQAQPAWVAVRFSPFGGGRRGLHFRQVARRGSDATCSTSGHRWSSSERSERSVETTRRTTEARRDHRRLSLSKPVGFRGGGGFDRLNQRGSRLVLRRW